MLEITQVRWSIPRRRGVASILAMLFLILISTLALGFYASVTSSVQVAKNELRLARAQVSAESGMEFIRHELTQISVPSTVTDATLMNEIHADLAANMNSTVNLAGSSVGLSGETINIPSDSTKFIRFESDGSEFRATLTRSGSSVRVIVTGRSGSTSIARSIQMDYSSRSDYASLFSHALASKGKLKFGGDLDSAGDDQSVGGSIFTASDDDKPIEIKKKAVIGGDIYYSNAEGEVEIKDGCSIAGSTDPDVIAQHLHPGTPSPEFPTFDTSVFLPYATNTYVEDQKKNGDLYYANTIIPAGTNPKFDKKTVIEGILYVKMPNKVTFDKECEVRGIIVYEPATGYEKEKDNKIEFKEGADLYSVDTLPATSEFPAELRALTGISILAPQASLKFKKKSGAWAGSIVADDIKFEGHSGGKITGTILSYGDIELKDKTALDIDPPTSPTPPPGLKFSSRFYASPSTYLEVQQ